MKALVVFDSMYGNTQKVAEAVAKALRAEMKSVSEIEDGQIAACNLLIVGTPVHGGRPSEVMKPWLDSLRREELKGKKVAVFDTRLEAAAQKKPLQWLMKVIGYAAPKMARTLETSGAEVIGEEGFIVMDKEGPLKDGELERAQAWVKGLPLK